MDNCRFYHTCEVANLFTRNNISIKFLFAYSPQLNPIEEFFHDQARYSTVKNENPNINLIKQFNHGSLWFYIGMQYVISKNSTMSKKQKQENYLFK